MRNRNYMNASTVRNHAGLADIRCGISYSSEARQPCTGKELADDKDSANTLKSFHRLLSLGEIPTWQRDNDYLISGYRPTSGSVRQSFSSLLYLNNQTVNSWSHLLGALVFGYLPFHFNKNHLSRHLEGQLADLIVVSIYCFGVATCFASSATFHILWNHSCSYVRFWSTLDYLGIVILMWGAGIPTIYYGFLCDPKLRVLYWSMTTTTALCCTSMTIHPRFASVDFRHWRACFYAGFGLSSVIFVIHGLWKYGWELQRSRMSLVFMGWMATANLMGAIIYSFRIPERWVPYQYDIWGASHQIFHVAVMLAACIHFQGLVSAFETARTMPNTCQI